MYPITGTSNSPFQTVTIDFITKLLPSSRYNTILIITDHNVSKASIFLPYAKVSALQSYMPYIFLHYRIPL